MIHEKKKSIINNCLYLQSQLPSLLKFLYCQNYFEESLWQRQEEVEQNISSSSRERTIAWNSCIKGNKQTKVSGKIAN